jgi:hypothetical protein
MVAMTCGKGSTKVVRCAWSIERTASSRAERRSKKVIPDRSTSTGPRRDEASFRVLFNSPMQKARRRRTLPKARPVIRARALRSRTMPLTSPGLENLRRYR